MPAFILPVSVWIFLYLFLYPWFRYLGSSDKLGKYFCFSVISNSVPNTVNSSEIASSIGSYVLFKVWKALRLCVLCFLTIYNFLLYFTLHIKICVIPKWERFLLSNLIFFIKFTILFLYRPYSSLILGSLVVWNQSYLLAVLNSIELNSVFPRVQILLCYLFLSLASKISNYISKQAP